MKWPRLFGVRRPRKYHPALERLIQREGNKITKVRFRIWIPDSVRADVKRIVLNESFLNALDSEQGEVVLKVPTKHGTLIVRDGEEIHSKAEAFAVVSYLASLGCIERA